MNNSNQYSNVYLEISPIYEFNQESDPWDIDYNPSDDFSLSGNLLIQNKVIFKSSQSLEEEEILEEKIKDLDKNGLNNKEEEKEEEIEINAEEILDMGIFSVLNKQNIPLPVPEKAKKECDEISNKSTDEKSKINPNGINKCLFGVKTQKKIEPRIDYGIKNFKVYLSKYLKDYGNELIRECKFKNKLKNMKLFAPSYKYFTGNSNEKDNKIYLNFTMEDIFSYPDKKLEKNDNRLQRQNKEMIKEFKEYIDEKYGDDVPENMQKVQNFFKMTFEDAIQLFYDSKQFKDYSSSQKTIFLDDQFTKSKGFSLLDKNAFIKLMKNYKRTD
jgi:hypothetical protein